MALSRRKAKRAETSRIPGPSELTVLETLAREHGPATHQELAEEAGIDPPSIYTVVMRLRQLGMVETSTEWRRRRRDGRRYRFAVNRLTPDGIRFTANWRAFMSSLGPKLRGSLR